MRRTFFVAFFCLIAGLGFAHAHTEAIRTVALTCEPAPGTPAGSSFVQFFPDTASRGFVATDIDNSGRVYFLAKLVGPGLGLLSDTGLWAETAEGTVKLIAKEFDNAPAYFKGQPSTEFRDLGIVLRDFMQPSYVTPTNLLVSGEGHALIRADIFGYDEQQEQVKGQALYRVVAGELELIAGSTKPAPGVSPAKEFQDLTGVALSATGGVAFSASLRRTPVIEDKGIWTNAAGDLEPVALAGHQAYDLPAGLEFFDFRTPDLNSLGKIAFGAVLVAPQESNNGLWSGTPGNIHLVVLEGDHAPGTPTDTNFDELRTTQLDSSGRLFFDANLRGPGIDETNNRGFWIEDAGSINLVAREGDPAPGLPSGVTFANFDDSPYLPGPLFNEAGKLVLPARLTGSGIDSTNNLGIWTGEPDSLSLIVRNGDPAPGLAGDAFAFVRPVGLSESGRLAVVGGFPGTVWGGNSNHGIWAQDISGQLQLIVKTGDLIEVAPGDYREVTYVQFGGINDRGQVVFRASFLAPNGPILGANQGIFVSNLVAVPEPASLLCAFGFLALVGSRGLGRK